jgi:microcystin-dependent protein
MNFKISNSGTTNTTSNSLLVPPSYGGWNGGFGTQTPFTYFKNNGNPTINSQTSVTFNEISGDVVTSFETYDILNSCFHVQVKLPVLKPTGPSGDNYFRIGGINSYAMILVNNRIKYFANGEVQLFTGYNPGDTFFIYFDGTKAHFNIIGQERDSDKEFSYKCSDSTENLYFGFGNSVINSTFSITLNNIKIRVTQPLTASVFLNDSNYIYNITTQDDVVLPSSLAIHFTTPTLSFPNVNYVTGFANGVMGQMLTLLSMSSTPVQFNAETGSSPNNRIYLGGMSDITLRENDNLVLMYSLTSFGMRWRLISYQIRLDVYAGEYRATALNTDFGKWLICDGRILTITDFTDLFAVISNKFGGDGTTTFALPDFRDRVFAGINNSLLPNGQSGNTALSARNLGDLFGEETHVLTVPELATHLHTGTTDSAGIHNHSIDDPSHSHSYFNQSNSTDPAVSLTTMSVSDNVNVNQTTGSSTTGITINNAGAHVHTFTSDTTGSSDPHNNIQPTLYAGNVVILSKNLVLNSPNYY